MLPAPSPEDDVAAFEEWRPLLFGIAYRMLGSAADAEDIVQDACVRYLRRQDREVASVRSYVVTIVTRLCIDHLASANVARVSYSGPWLPEPVVFDEPSSLEQADSLSMAFLVLLEELTPPERAAYLLHDIFGYRFDEVADSMGRPAPTCRQLALRARKRIEDRRQRFDADLQHGRELARRFVAACGTGDLDALLAMLAEDVVVWTDGGGQVRAAMRPVVGPHRGSRFLINVAKKGEGRAREMLVNGQPAFVFVDDERVVMSVLVDILGGQIVGVRVVSNPDKLEWLTAELARTGGIGR
ncbi:MAG TPA: RNA polymerase sigma factor SigJ [Acidimicrobiales bacterium]|jgi:RNA polymerase sigma-70 factor (ECF subfamily)|nr:RNA polymerase sigma factor SigJ [Acidimicrobiales bacterium]